MPASFGTSRDLGRSLAERSSPGQPAASGSASGHPLEVKQSVQSLKASGSGAGSTLPDSGADQSSVGAPATSRTTFGQSEGRISSAVFPPRSSSLQDTIGKSRAKSTPTAGVASHAHVGAGDTPLPFTPGPDLPSGAGAANDTMPESMPDTFTSDSPRSSGDAQSLMTSGTQSVESLPSQPNDSDEFKLQDIAGFVPWRVDDAMETGESATASEPQNDSSPPGTRGHASSAQGRVKIDVEAAPKALVEQLQQLVEAATQRAIRRLNERHVARTVQQMASINQRG
jgi:hypothetical protein